MFALKLVLSSLLAGYAAYAAALSRSGAPL